MRARERERERERDELDIFLAENVVERCSGLAESSSVVEIDSALVRLPASTNSGESGGDDLSETERNFRGNEPRGHRTETTERDRAASQALESSGVLTDEALLQGLNTPRGLSRVLEGSEPLSGGPANGGGPSPRTDVERALRALPDFLVLPANSGEERLGTPPPRHGWECEESCAGTGGLLRRHYVHRRDMFSPRSVRPSTGEYGFGSAIAQLQDKVRGHRAL